eukprot:1639079-Rhodomonas_salina.2
MPLLEFKTLTRPRALPPYARSAPCPNTRPDAQTNRQLTQRAKLSCGVRSCSRGPRAGADRRPCAVRRP